MLNKKDILSIILISLVTIGLISYFTVSHINSLRKLNESSNDSSDIQPLIFLDLNNKKTMEKIFQKIDHYKSIERPIDHISPSTLLEEEKEAKKLRNLEEWNTFEDVSLIDAATEPYYYIMRWIAVTAKQFTSNIILYPYSFLYKFGDESANNTEIKNFTQGAFISLNPSELKSFNNIGRRTDGTFQAKKARAVFDADFAILSVEYIRDYNYDEAFQDSIDWSTYFQTFYGKGTTLSSFQAFLEAKKANPTKTYATKINETDVINGNLLNNGLPRFGFLIISDYLLGTEDLIKSKLGEQGIQNIKNYYNQGGKIIVNGKSGTLLEDFGLMKKGVYNRKKLLSMNTEDRKAYIIGCDKLYGKIYEKDVDDFEKQLMCMSMNKWRAITLASTFKTVLNDTSFTSLINLNGNNKDLILTDVDDGLSTNLTQEEKYYNPLVLFKKNNKNGQIFVLNYNPFISGGDRNIILNIIALALSKDLYMTSKVMLNTDVDANLVDNLPIPAGEFGFQIKISLIIHNLNDKPMNKSQLYLFLPDNFGWTSAKPHQSCERKAYDVGEIPYNIRVTKTVNNKNDYLVCNLNDIEAFKKFNFEISVSVLNNEATQTKYQVLILEPILSYYDEKNLENILFDPIKVNCEAAPVIRAAINPDPSSVYPLPGRGYYVDNILKVENKEESKAYNVSYYGLIPLISPIVDGDDQRKTQWSLKIYADYYNSNDFNVPFGEEDNEEDYIYSAELIGKGVKIIMEWDSPVLPVKELNTKNKEGLGQNPNIPGINCGLVTINSTSEVIKQINYRNSDRLYKLASQRLMVFVDTTSPEGAKTIYNGEIPSDLVDPVYGDRTKKDFLYTRLDIYFYENNNYVNPPGITEKHIFSVDKMTPYTSKDNCVDTRGKASSRITPGYFTNSKSDSTKRKIILQPNIYSNELFDYCNLKVIDPTEKGALEKEFGNTDDFKLIHYIIPNVEDDVIRPGQLYNFAEIDEHHGYHKTYNSIKFIYLHSLEYVLNGKYCKYGGKININIGSFDITSVEEQVTVSPDQIAVYKIEYSNHIISIYFKRGLMSNEQFGKDITLRINIEGLKSEKTEPFDFSVQEMTFDLSNPPEYELYGAAVVSGKKDFKYISVFSYPALQIKTILDRELNGYETLEPFSRYGVYTQELGHRTVYGTMETHHQSDPGLQGSGGGFSLISNLGISSIPFIEYMTVGKGQVIPAGPATSRMTWKDIWGRTWQQPLRSVFPDIPPIPPPLKNFMMSTTYEVVRYGQQIYEWPSDENNILIHLHIKLLNNYPKYFEITRCKENQIRYVPSYLQEDHNREYTSTCDKNLNENELNGNKMFLRQGGFASYGICYHDNRAYVSGKKVEGELYDQIGKARLCADYTDVKLIEQCEEELASITTVSRSSKDWDETKSGKWNYSPLVESYYPNGYISSDMWQLTHVDYYDNAMDKAYNYHVDNLLPNYDNKILKPHNTIAIPIYKGLGYSISYNKSTTFNYHGKTKSGWWSDNLQNKDDTLLAGQDICNEISVNKEPKITWVDGKDLVGSKRSGSDEAAKKIINYRQGNIYTCLYNRKRPQYIPDNGKSYYAGNVVENNIVPVIVNLEKDDDRLEHFDCNNVKQYTEDDLYKEEGNYLETPTSKDYLYFAANLRGHAKESFNIVMTLKSFDKIQYEGYVKVNEGGRFVYWNPVNGPNSFLVVDDPVNVINAKRNDIKIINNIFPGDIDTFNSVIYHSYIFRDENKINKEWPHYDFYANSYGFGDVAVSVYVGGINKSKPVLQPNSTTYAKITIYNNCGFDLNMKVSAIDFEYKGTEPLNANDLLYHLVHVINVPKKYNFLTYTVEKEYSQYITIEPSDHNIRVGPEFFDFDNINVVTIRDGFKGEYALKITVLDNFPDKLRGKPIEIQIGLDTSYFDRFPGEASDPIKYYHNYKVKIPSIYIAVPFKGGENDGKVLYTSAQASDLYIQFDVGVDWQIDGIKYISAELLEKMQIATQEEKKKELLNKLWNDNLKNLKNISHTETQLNDNTKRIKIDGIKEEFEFFPKKNLGQPDTAEAIIIIRSSVSQISRGNTYPIQNLRIYYKDWINKTKLTYGSTPYVTAQGPWIELTYSRRLVDYLGKGRYLDRPIQELSPDESGTMKVQFKLQNTGNGHSYDTKFEITIDPNLVLIDYDVGTNKISSRTNEKGQIILTFDYGVPILAGEPKGGILYFNYSKICDSYDILTQEEKDALPKKLTVSNTSDIYMNLEENSTEKDSIVQHLRTHLDFSYSIKKKTSVNIDLVISGKRSNPTVTIKPKVHYVGNDTEDNIQIYIGKADTTKYTTALRNLDEIEENFKYESIYIRGNFTKEVKGKKDKPITKEKENKDHVVQYTVIVYGQDGSVCFNSLKYEQRKIHISTAEVVLIILSIIFYSVAAFFIWKGISNWQKINSGKIERSVKNTQMQKLLDD